MDPADGMDFSGQPHLTGNEPMDDFDFGVGSTLHHPTHLPAQGDLDDLGNTDAFDWSLLPNETFTQPRLFDEYQGFVTPQPYQDRFAQSLPTLPERRLYEHEGFSPLSTQTSNETLTTSDQQPRRRSIRKRRIENGYHCNEPYCQEAFDTAGELTKHCYRKHTPEAAWPFACPACGKRFYDRRDYRRHENVERKRANAVASVRQSETASPKNAEQPVEERHEGEKVEKESGGRQAQFEDRRDDYDMKKSLEFSRANDQHISATDLLEAATSDLKRFIGLGANHVTIQATVHSQGESMSISSIHTLKSQSAETTSSNERLKKPHTPTKPFATAPSPQPETSKPDRTDLAAIIASPRISSQNRKEAPSPPISPVVATAVTLTFRSRPAFPRSVTHPAGLRMVGVGCC